MKITSKKNDEIYKFISINWVKNYNLFSQITKIENILTKEPTKYTLFSILLFQFQCLVH